MASIINASTSGAGGVITTADASGTLQIQTAGTTAIAVDASQNVGIGTSSPSTKLQVNGTSGTAQFQVQTASGGGFLQFNAFDSAGAYCVIGGSSSTIGVFGTQSNIPTAFFTNNTERMRIDSSGYITNQANGNTAGLVQGYKYYRLDSGLAGANATGAQNIFGVGVTLIGGTVYEFEICFVLAKSAGTTSHTVGIGFGGTATLNNISYQALANPTITASGTTSATTEQNFITSAANNVQTPAITNAIFYLLEVVKGTVSINAGGTFIPQYTLSAAPGGAYTTQAGSYIKISPISASGANTNIGSWA